MLLDVLLLRDDDGGIPEPVALLDTLRERLPEMLREGWTESDGVILSPKDPLRDGVAGFDRERVGDTVIVRVAVKEHDLNNGLQDRVTLEEGPTLLDALPLPEDDGGMAEPVGLLDTVLDDETKTYAVLLLDDDTVMLRDDDAVMLRDDGADTLLVLVNETATEGEALNEHDLNSGLQERVTLTVAGLLIDALALRDDDGGTPEPVALLETLGERLTDLLLEAWTERDGLILSPKDPLRDGVAGFDRDTVGDTVIVSVAVKEHDLNNGLQERVTLTVGGLLIDALALREDEGGSADLLRLEETDDDILFDA